MKNMKRFFKKEKVLVSIFALGLGYGAYVIDPAMLYHTFPPEVQKERVIKTKTNNTITHRDLETKLGVNLKGEYSDEMAKEIETTFENIRLHNPKLLSSVEKVVVVPSTYETDYSGAAFLSYKMILKEGAASNTIAHEAGHNYSLSLSDEFWDRWTKISFGHYKHNYIPEFWMIMDKLSGFKYNPNFTLKNGLLTDYGSTNKYEDIAEFVEDVYTGNKKLSQVSKKENIAFKEKLELLREYDFITKRMHKDSLKALSSMSIDTIEEKIASCMKDLKAPSILSEYNSSLVLYESMDKKCSITYYAGMHGSGLVLVPDKNQENIFVSIHQGYPEDIRMSLANVKGERELEIFPSLKKKLSELGYFDGRNYSISKYYVDNKNTTKTSVATENKLPLNILNGPITSISTSWKDVKMVQNKREFYYAEYKDVIKLEVKK